VRSHQPLLNGARTRDDFGDGLSFGLELGLRLVEAQSMGRLHRSARSNCSKLLHNSGRIGGRTGFATFVESNE